MLAISLSGKAQPLNMHDGLRHTRVVGLRLAALERMMRTTFPRTLSRRTSTRINQSPKCLVLRPIPKHHLLTSQSTTRELNQGRSPQNRTRNIQYAFDPVNTARAKRPSNPFSFLRPENIALPVFQNANCLVPSNLGVPWPTSFPSSFQSKYSTEVEETTRAYTRALQGQRSEGYQEKYPEAIIDEAVSLLVNVAPMGNLTRMKALTKLYVFFFMSDGD
ncbi:hypothetical protein BDV38DRAFT_1986 [Aspergillus pseudotamarii]|uniref:Uncharacterized protein n=1 Tax=Aspergillus pseudotamarii TaxID=132259 RepID=A0A5N6TBQ8_ASPPS|nr:uncharacterized protein BDV38DRAFT_1986 [Aspergillus pseudotamarii]KAE8143707.1 hypothetical protein BDV38DRAFT_1986 [Aspergillus pseudotamarii]